MNETSFIKRSGAAMVGVASVALAGGYLLRGQVAGAQTTIAPAATTPVVQTAATRDASAIQDAFAQVTDAVEPAVVTITTSGKVTPNSAKRSPFGPAPLVARPMAAHRLVTRQTAPIRVYPMCQTAKTRLKSFSSSSTRSLVFSPILISATRFARASARICSKSSRVAAAAVWVRA